MPEGPEIKLSADLIKQLTINKYITNISFGDTSRYSQELPSGFVEFNKILKERQNSLNITSINTKGKFMYWQIEDQYMWLTFGMTGQLSPKPGKHICMHIELKDDNNQISHIYFNDPRHFGTIRFNSSKLELTKKLNELGWDPFQDDLNKYISNIILKLRTKKPIGQMLMDQSIIAGSGNYLRAECLYLSKISPWRPSNALSQQEIIALCQNMKQIMQDSYAHQGATIQTYATPYGEEGKYSSNFKVYGKKTDPAGYKVIKEETPDKRTIHWCPDIQK